MAEPIVERIKALVKSVAQPVHPAISYPVSIVTGIAALFTAIVAFPKVVEITTPYLPYGLMIPIILVCLFACYTLSKRLWPKQLVYSWTDPLLFTVLLILTVASIVTYGQNKYDEFPGIVAIRWSLKVLFVLWLANAVAASWQQHNYWSYVADIHAQNLYSVMMIIGSLADSVDTIETHVSLLPKDESKNARDKIIAEHVAQIIGRLFNKTHPLKMIETPPHTDQAVTY